MKTLRSVLCALTVLLMATAAQAQQTYVKANIPFDFIVGDHAYPAGEYSLKSVLGNSNSALIEIAGTEEAQTTRVLSNACASVTPAAKTKLVFRRMGDSYFLYQIWVVGNLSGREFPRSSTEMRLAQNHAKAELVIVAANISQ